MELGLSPREKEAFEFFKKAHGNQRYQEGLPYWYHIFNVAFLLKSILKQHNEMNEREMEDLVMAAFGHDSIEDTEVNESEIRENFGETVLEFIKGMTNDEGDHDTSKYEDKVISSREEIRLLKMADSLDNYQRIAYRVPENNPKWLKEKIIPIMENMFQRIIKTEFSRYPNTAEDLKKRLITAHNLAFEAIDLSI